jgi:hypothetical protein
LGAGDLSLTDSQPQLAVFFWIHSSTLCLGCWVDAWSMLVLFISLSLVSMLLSRY